MKTKLLYLAQNTIEGNIIKAELNERNISCYLAGSNLQIAIGALPVDAMFSKVYVDEADFKVAKEYIEHYKTNLEKIALEMTDTPKNVSNISYV